MLDQKRTYEFILGMEEHIEEGKRPKKPITYMWNIKIFYGKW